MQVCTLWKQLEVGREAILDIFAQALVMFSLLRGDQL